MNETSYLQLSGGTETSYYSEEYKNTTTDILKLPDDVLLKIFSLLPLKSVLQLEVVCRRFHSMVCAYLRMIKSLNFHHSFITQDIFRRYDPTVRQIPSSLAGILTRCPHANHIVYLPSWGLTSEVFAKEVILSLCEHKNITQIEFCDSWELKHLRELSHLNVKHVCMSSVEDSMLSKSLCNGPRLILERKSIEEMELALLAEYVEIALKECKWMLGSPSAAVEHFTSLTKLRSFTYIEPCQSRPHPTVLTNLMKCVVGSQRLESLNLGLSNFQCLEDIVVNWNVDSLQSLEIRSTGSYSATLQQMRYAKTVAELCHNCAHSLKHLTLPSSILVKQFFTYLISKGRLFPCLLKLDMTGLADTKMFLAPGNMVETLYYQEFIKLCPKIESLSLHSFSGSLLALGLPLTITDLTLPWDNRLNMSRQISDVLCTLGTLSNLQKLSIAGVEEVDGLLLEALNVFQSERPPVLELESKSVHEVQISNICVRRVDLTRCTGLSRFTLHCCPHLKKLSLPISTLEQVHIYDGYGPYMDQFISEFSSKTERMAFCRIHIQLHAVKRREVEDMVAEKHYAMADKVFANVESALLAGSKRLDFLIFKEEGLHLFQHNSGELMYPFTELHPNISSSSRSAEELHDEMDRRSFVMEGIKRWQDFILAIKSAEKAAHPEDSICKTDLTLCTKPRNSFKVNFCHTDYFCSTNIPFIKRVNGMPHICQPSSLVYESDTLDHLNVPRLDAIGGHSRFDVDKSLSSVSSDPLVVVSIMEYAHDIHTLFYYA